MLSQYNAIIVMGLQPSKFGRRSNYNHKRIKLDASMALKKSFLKSSYGVDRAESVRVHLYYIYVINMSSISFTVYNKYHIKIV